MKKLLLVPALLLAACGDNLSPTEDEVSGGTAATDSASPEDPAEELELYAALVSEPYDCDTHSVLLRGFAGYSGGAELDSPICHFELADGRTFDTCYQVVSLPTAQNVVLTVTDPATGTTARHEEVITGPAFEPRLDVSSGGMWIAWSIEADQGVDRVFVDFDPIQNVVIQDPEQQGDPFGVVQVTQAGTYTVTGFAVRNFGDVLSCTATLVKTIEVACEGDAH